MENLNEAIGNNIASTSLPKQFTVGKDVVENMTKVAKIKLLNKIKEITTAADNRKYTT